MKKIIRACTVSMSIGFVSGMLPDLCKKYEVVLLSSPGPEMDDAEAKYGVRGIRIPMERHISPVKDFIALCKIIRVLWKEKPDMVHSMTPKAGLLCMIAAWLTRVPVRVHTFTGLVFPTAAGIKKRILMLTDAITCWCATHVIPEGEGVKNDLLNNGITKKPLKVLGYGNVRGIDMQRFSCGNLSKGNEKTTDNSDKDKLKTKNSFEFLFVGRIVRDKGINELVEAFVRLNEELPETRLVLVGFFEENLDPVSAETKTLINTHPAIDAVGEKTGDDLIAHYAAADCFVFPSYREGFPNTVLEAGAMGLPCIVTDINGSREIITNVSHADNADSADNIKTTDCTDLTDNKSLAEPTVADRREKQSAENREKEVVNIPRNVSVKSNGLIIPSKDAEALYEAMKLMVKSTEMREAMAANARPMIESRYEQGFVRQCLYDFYEDILDS